MKIKLTCVMLILIMSYMIPNAQILPDKGKLSKTEDLAQKLVNQCAHIQEGDFVLIIGGVRNFQLLEDVAVNVRKLGAFPFLSMGSDRMTRRMFIEVPEKYDTQKQEASLKLYGIVDAIISVDYSDTTGLLADIPAERIIKIGKTFEPVNQLVVDRNVKGVYLGNTLFPTDAVAKQYGLSKNELADIIWRGLNVDYSQLEATGKTLQTLLSNGKEIQITHPNGTNLKVRTENRPVNVCDGVISDADEKNGFASSQVYLPAGEVFVTPVPGSAEGTIVIDRHYFQGKEINGLTLTFKAGKLVSMTAKSGLEPLKKLYDAAESSKEEFGFVDFGINPNMQIQPGYKLDAWMPAGLVTVGIGNNLWAGGKNNGAFGQPFLLPGSTVKVDGKVLVENGVLQKLVSL